MLRARVLAPFGGAALAATVAGVLWLPIGAAARSSAGGPWSGSWNRLASEIDPAGPTLFTLHQNGVHLSGAIGWRGCTTKKGGVFVGFAQGNDAVVASRQTDGTLVTVHMRLSANHAHITGRYTVTAGTCAGASGPFDATRVR
jgi:hypothetical protein